MLGLLSTYLLYVSETARCRLGPDVGGCMSRKNYRFVRDARFVPATARQSVHGMPVIAGSIELARRYRTSYQQPPGSHITSQERYTTTNILAFTM